MAGLLVVVLSGINVMALVLSHAPTYSLYPCGYRDFVHNIMQIIARFAFLYVTVNTKQDCGGSLGVCNTDSVIMQHTWVSGRLAVCSSPCGLCYKTAESEGCLVELQCGHSYHKACFKTWKNCGTRCPVCSVVFRRPYVQQAFAESRELGI